MDSLEKGDTLETSVTLALVDILAWAKVDTLDSVHLEKAVLVVVPVKVDIAVLVDIVEIAVSVDIAV